MKKSIWAAAAMVFAVGLVACSGSSSSVVGTWAIDVDKTVDPILDKAMAAMEAPRKMLESLPADQRAQAEAKFPTREAMKKQITEKMADGNIEVKADGTYVGHMKGEKEAETSTGTWVEKDGSVTFTPKTNNGKPAEGEKATPRTAVWEGSQLVMKMEAPKRSEAIGMTEIKIYFNKK